MQLLKDKSVHHPYYSQENLDILHSSGRSVEKGSSHEELMDFYEINHLIADIFPSVTMSDMAEYSKEFLSMFDALFLSIHANHCTNAFQDLIDSQPAISLVTLFLVNAYKYLEGLKEFFRRKRCTFLD